MVKFCIDIKNHGNIDWLLQNWKWHNLRRHVSPTQSQRCPGLRFRWHFLWKPKTFNFWKSCASAKLELRATTTQERLRNHCENGMKSSIILLLKNVWFLVSYIRLTACVSVLLDSGDSVKFFRRKFRGQRVKYSYRNHKVKYTLINVWNKTEFKIKMLND